MNSSQPFTPNPEIERTLEQQIEPWLAHMRWRSDFDEWRKRRIWQENYQHDAVAEVTRWAPHNARVLDLGAGMGGFAVAMERTGAHIVAFDYNFAYCEITRARAAVRFEFARVGWRGRDVTVCGKPF